MGFLGAISIMEHNKLTYIVLDTMVFLHYQPLEKINFADILGSANHVVVIPLITLNELDQHKNTHQNPQIRERVPNFFTINIPLLFLAIFDVLTFPVRLTISLFVPDSTLQ